MKKIYLLLCFLILSQALYSARVYVLCYHSFLNKTNVSTDFSMDEMKMQIKMLKDGGMNFVRFEDILNNKVYGNNNVLITIDDGNHSVYSAYKNVFKPSGIKPVLAIYPNPVGKSKNQMTWAQIDEIVKDGASVMSHGFFHEYLKEDLYRTNKAVFEQEIYKPKKILDEKYNNSVAAYAYPFGYYSDTAIAKIKDAGYKMAFTINPGPMELPYAQNSNVYLLPRYMVVRSAYKSQLNKIIADSKK